MTVSQKWDKRVGQWHDHVNSAAAFGKVLDRILVLSQPQPSDVCVGPEHPATPEFWQQALRDAGLTEVCFHPVAAEAGIVCGVRPTSGRGGR